MVRLAGSIALERGDLVVSERDLPGRQLRAAFVFLVLGRGRPISHDELAEALWPEGPPATWQAALRGIVSKVRGFLEAGAIDGAAALVGEAGRYRLDLPSDAVVDVEQAEAAVDEAAGALDDGSIEQARTLASEARAVLTQPLLPGVDAPWLDRWRDELGVAHVRALGVLGTCRLRAGEHGDARTVFEEIVRYDPFDEVAWRGLMEVHAAAGRTAKALAVYEELRDLLADELGADPSPATRELHLRLLRGEHVADDEPVASTDVAQEVQDALDEVPYRGLEHFREQDADRFFGREPDVQRLVGMLGRHRFVAVVGSSGSGKSSLVRAGLLPTLARGGLPDADTWAYATLVPGDDPLQSLSGALADVWPIVDRRLLADRLRVEASALDETVARLLAGASTGRRLLLVVDQFEELFSLTRDAGAREAFIDALLDAARSPAGRILIVLTMRADFVARAAEHVRLAEALTTSQFVLGPLDPDGVERAIEGPLRRVGARFEDGLVARILTDVVGEPGALPLLQHALLELWTRRTDDGVLTRQAYEEIGGVAGALARRAETTYAGFDHDHRTLARRVLLRLTEPGEGTDDTRRRATMTELSGIGDPDEVEEVVRALADARLLTTGVDHDGVRTIEVAHEALIRGWPRLAGWIDDDREGLRLHRRLTVASRDWDRAERDEDLLWRGGRLATAVPWAEQHLDDLDDLEAAFLRASREAEEQALRRRRRLQRTLLSVAVGAAAVLAVLALVAVGARNDAEDQRQLARSRGIAAESTNALGSDPELALLVALEAYEVAPTLEAEAAIRAAHERNDLRWQTDGPYDRVQVDPAGTVVVAAGYAPDGGILGLYDLTTGAELATATFPGTRGMVDVVFASDGRIAAVEQNGEVVVLAPDLDELARLPNAAFVSWSPDDRYLIGATVDTGVWVANGTTYELLFQLEEAGLFDALGASPTGGGSHPGSFTADGHVLLQTGLFSERPRHYVLELASGNVVAEFPSEPGIDVSAFGPAGERVAYETAATLEVVATDDWTSVRSWPLETGLADLVWIDASRVGLLTDAGTVEVLDVDEGSVTALTGLTGARGLHVVADRLVGFGTQGAVVWDPDTGARLDEIVGAPFAGAQVYGLEADARSLVIAFESGLAAFDVDLEGAGGKVLATETLTRGPWYGELSSGHVVALTMGIPGPIQVLDLDRMEVVHEAVSMAGEGLAVSDTGTSVATGSGTDPARMSIYDQQLRELASWQVFDEDECPPEETCHLAGFAFSPDGGRVAVGSRQGVVRVFEIDGTLVREFPPEPVHVGSRVRLAFTADGRRILRSMLHPTDPHALLDLDDGSVTPIGGHEGRAGDLVARSIVTGAIALGDLNGRVTVHDPETLEIVRILEHSAGIKSIDFVGRDRILVAAGETATLWDLRSGRPIAAFGGNPSELRGALWLEDDRVATFDRAGDVRLHRCRACGPMDEVVAAARGSVTRALTPAERALYLG